MTENATLRTLAEFITRTSLPDIPAAVLSDGHHSLVDTMACMLGGSTVTPVRRLAQRLHDPDGSARLVGTAYRATLHDVALLGGMAGTWMDADSGGTKHPAGGRVPPVPTAHPPVHIVPALLASLPAARVIDGAELLRIYVLSYEVGARIGTGSRLLPGVHPHGVHGTSSAAIAAAMLRRLPPDAIARAIELATALPLITSLRVAMTGATVRNAYAGLGARNGILAAEAAAAGSGAPPGSFRGVLTGSVSDGLDEGFLVEDLGRHWEVTRGYIKLHACARWIHPALDAAASLLPADGMDPGLIEEITVRTFRFAAMMSDPRPRTDLAGKFSVPYAIAALVAFGRVELEAFTPSAMQRADILDLAARVRLVDDPGYTAALPARRPTSVAIRFRDGREVSATVDGSRGDPETAFSTEEIEAKFLRLAEAALGSERAARALELLRRLPELSDARRLIDAVTT